MMGSKARIFTPVSALSLDDLVPADHFYHHLDRVLDLSFVRELVKEMYATGGCPSIDPVIFFKLQRGFMMLKRAGQEYGPVLLLVCDWSLRVC
jgi:hypothetical protein